MNLYQELQTKITTLETENATLKATITAFEQRLLALEKTNDPDVEWKEYYSEFTENVTEELASYFAYDYGTESKILNFWDTNEEGDAAPAGEYLLILHDKDTKKHFIRMIVDESGQYTVYFDEVYLHENAPNSEGGLSNIDINIDSVDNKSFDAVYKKTNDPDAEWKEFYSEYSQKYESENLHQVIYYLDTVKGNQLEITLNDDIYEGLWLFVLTDLDGKKHFFEWNLDEGHVRFDKFYNNDATFSIEAEYVIVENLNVSKDTEIPVDAAYRKPK